MAASCSVEQTVAVDLGALLDAREGAVVTLVAGETRLAAHKAVLSARCPVFEALFRQLEDNSEEVTICDVEGPVLRQLLAYLYTLQAPQLPPGLAPQLLAAAQKYRVLGLMNECEKQVATQLSVETAAATAFIAVKYGCPRLEEAAISFIKANTHQVMATKGWEDALRCQPKVAVEVTRLLSEPPAESRTLSAEEKAQRLIKAAKEGVVGDLEALLAAGTDVEARGGGMVTALHEAAAAGHVEAARRLLCAGAEVDARNNLQATPLHRAARNGHAVVARLLVAASADPDAREHQQWTPMHFAAWGGHAAVVRFLQASSADIDARDEDSWTPLHLAANLGNAEAAAALLKAGADRGSRTEKGNTPLDFARQKKHQKLIDMLT